MCIKSESNVVSLLEDKNEIPYEEHIMIAGIESDCNSLKSSTTLNNNGNFELRCSSDNKNIIVARGDQPVYEEVEDDPVTSSTNDDDTITSNSNEGENTNDKPIVDPSNDDDPNTVPSNDDSIVVPSNDGDGDGDGENSNNGPNDPGKSDTNDKSLPVGGIVGIVIACIVVVAAVVVVVIFVLKKKKNNGAVSSDNEDNDEGEVGL